MNKYKKLKKEEGKLALPVSHFFDSQLTGRAEMNGNHHSKHDRPSEAWAFT